MREPLPPLEAPPGANVVTRIYISIIPICAGRLLVNMKKIDDEKTALIMSSLLFSDSTNEGGVRRVGARPPAFDEETFDIPASTHDVPTRRQSLEMSEVVEVRRNGDRQMDVLEEKQNIKEGLR